MFAAEDEDEAEPDLAGCRCELLSVPNTKFALVLRFCTTASVGSSRSSDMMCARALSVQG